MEMKSFTEEAVVQPSSKGKFRITRADIGDPPVAAAGATWILSLVNRTNECYVYVQTRNNNGAWGKWYGMTPACRNCDLASFKACFDAKKYVSILVTDCTSAPFDINIASEPDANGNANGASYTGIKPNCNRPGGVIGIDP